MSVIGILALASMGLVGVVVGTKLLLLARRTRQLPELAIGLGLLLIMVVGAPLSAAGRIPALVRTPLGDASFALGLVAAMAGIALLFVFTWRVFRPQEPWARNTVAFAVLVLGVEWAGIVGANFQGETLDEILPRTRPWGIAIVASVAACFVWSGVEALAYHARLRRRLAVGLVDPVVVDRMLLWGISAVACVLLLTVISLCMAAGQAPLRDPLPLAAIAAACNVASATWYLAFLPPRAYQAWVRRRAGATPA